MRGLSPRLELRQTQRLTITPQVRQSIEMLQLSNLEVTDFITAEIEQNPLLEWRERQFGENALANYANDGERVSPTAVPEMLTGEVASDATEDWQPEWREDSEHAVDFGGELQPWLSRNEGFKAKDRREPDQTATRPRTLREHLLEQIGVDLSDQGDRLIASHLLDLIDQDGYLRTRLDGVAQQFSCGIDRVEGVLGRLQEFDPAGVFARDLKECLELQLRDRNRFDPAMQALLNHLELLADDDISALVCVCGVDAADMADMIREIQSLDPKPGDAFDRLFAPPVVPDILMRAQPSGGWIVELNPQTLPRVLVNNSYYTRVYQATRSKADKDYLTERLHAAKWLVEALHERATTIRKSRGRDRPPAGRLLPSGCSIAATADPARHRRCDRQAREHDQQGYQQQIHGHPARSL